MAMTMTTDFKDALFELAIVVWIASCFVLVVVGYEISYRIYERRKGKADNGEKGQGHSEEDDKGAADGDS